MFEPFDTTRLLALVEGELSAEQERALRGELAEHPRVLEALDRIVADRAALRTVPPPALPGDLVAELEPLLARPMLVESRPGAYRRRAHRGRRRRAVRRAVLVAAALVVVSGATVALMNAWPSSTSEAPARVAAADPAPAVKPAPPRPADDGGALAAVGQPPEGGTVHHPVPSPELIAQATAPEPGAPPRGSRPAATDPVILPFALQVSGATDGTPVIGELAAALDASTSLHRNLTLAEAREIELRWLAARARARRDRPAPDAVADLSDPDRIRSLATRVREEIRFSPRTREPSGPSPLGEHLAGPGRLAPGVAEQLTISTRGAGHTISITAAGLQTLLERIHAAGRLQARLRMLPEDGDEAPAGSWPEDLARIRAALAEIEADGGDAVVLLPVVVEAGDDP